MFSREHYQAIADAMADSKSVSASTQLQWAKSVESLAEMFADDNPRFDRSMFLEACGYDESAWYAGNIPLDDSSAVK